MLKADLVTRDHNLFWWYVKVALGIVLVAGIVARFGFEFRVHSVALPIEVGQLLVCLGVGVYFYHYAILKQRFARLSSPTALECSRGLYRRVRHPMYLGDIIYYAGMALMWPGWLSLTIWALSVFAVQRQAVEEDGWSEATFPDQYHRWKAHSRLLIPWVG